jgi:hypothetical protein
MPLPLDGRVIAIAEARQLEELASMLEKEGASVLHIPMVAMLDAEDPAPVALDLDDLDTVWPHGCWGSGLPTSSGRTPARSP